MDWVAVIFSVVGCVLSVFKRPSCWLFWMAGAALWLIIAYQQGNIPQLIVWVVFLLVDIWGYREWTKEAKPHGYGEVPYGERLDD